MISDAQYITCRMQNCSEAVRSKPFPGYIDSDSLIVQDDYVFVQVWNSFFSLIDCKSFVLSPPPPNVHPCFPPHVQQNSLSAPFWCIRTHWDANCFLLPLFQVPYQHRGHGEFCPESMWCVQKLSFLPIRHPHLAFQEYPPAHLVFKFACQVLASQSQ